MGTEAGSKTNFFSVLYVLGKQLSSEWMGHHVWIPHTLFNTSIITNHLWSIAGSKELSNPSQLYGPKTTFSNLPKLRTTLKISRRGETSTTKSEIPSLSLYAWLQVDSEGKILANYCITKRALRAMGSPLCSLLINPCQACCMVSWMTLHGEKFMSSRCLPSVLLTFLITIADQ